MRNLRKELSDSRIGIRFLVLVSVFCVISALTPLSGAFAPTVTITVVNNSQREVCTLYLSPADNNNWGSNLLNGSSIGSGTSRTLNVSWDEANVKLVAEDQDGCFLSTTVEASGSRVWTITSDTPRNCGD